MSKPLRLLVVGVPDAEVAPLTHELRRHGYEPESVRVDTADTMRKALQSRPWDVVIADHALAGFGSREALRVLQESGLDLPFIIVSETAGEEAAVAAMKAGAHDYLMKDHLTRLGPAVERELQEATVRQQRREAEQALAAQQAVTCILAETETLGEAGAKILQAIAKTGDWEAGEIWMVDRQSNVLRCLGIWHAAGKPLGDFETQTRAMTFARGVGLPGRVWASGQPVWIADVTQDANFPRAPLAVEAGLCGAMGFPIVVGHELIGVIAFFRTAPGQPDGKTLPVLGAVSSQVGQFLVRLQTEAELRKLSSAVEQTANSVLITNRQGVIEYVNPAFEQTTGYARAEAIGQTPRLLKSGHHDLEYYKTLWNTVLAGETFFAEFVNRKKSGELYYTEQSITPIRDGRGQITHFVATGRDLTERKRAEAALRESEDRYRSLVEESPDAIGIFQEDKLVFVNATGARQLGAKAKEELLGMNGGQLIHPDDAPAVLARIQRRLAGETGMYPIEVRYRRLDGTALPVEVSAAPVNFGGKPAVQFIARDITERLRAAESLRRSEARYRTLAESAQDIIYVISRDFRVEYINEYGALQFGHAVPEMAGKHLTELFPPETTQWQLPDMAGIFRTGVALHRERQLPAGQRLIWLDSTLVPIKSATGEVEAILGISRNITARKQAERQMLRTQRLESIGTLAGGVAHDLNNALAPIMLAAELLRLQFPDQASIYLELIQSSAQRGAGMVKQLLTFARGAEGERLLVQPRHLFQEIEKLIQGTFPKNIRLETHPGKDLRTILGDATQLHQVLLNLCVNARDAMPNGGTLTLHAEDVEIDAVYASAVPEAKPGFYILWRVTDTGTGIPPEILDRIFDPFFTTKGPDKGTGLGLSSVIGIVRGHGGFVRVYSTPGRGSTFAVYLPAGETGIGDSALLTTGDLGFHGNGETILVVDDEAAVRNVLRDVLTKLNFKVLTAADGTAALIQVAEHWTELRTVITDLHMPHMDGLSFARVVKAKLPQTGIIVTSGRLDDREADEFKQLGVHTRLDKPFTHEKLVEALKASFAK